MEELILLVFFGAVIWLFAYVINLSQKDKTPGFPSIPEDAPLPVEEPEPVPQRPQRYTSIYEYEFAQNVINCAVCDGENPYGAKFCSICGNEIDS